MPWIMSGIQAAGELCRKSIVGIKHVWLKKRIYKIYKIYAHESRWRNHQLTYHLLISFVSQKGGVVCFFLYGKMNTQKKGKLLWSGKTHFVPPAPSVQSWLHGALAWSVGSHLRLQFPAHVQTLRRVFFAEFESHLKIFQVSELPSLSWLFNNASVLSSFWILNTRNPSENQSLMDSVSCFSTSSIWFYLNCLHWHHQRSMFEVFIKLVGDDWENNAKCMWSLHQVTISKAARPQLKCSKSIPKLSLAQSSRHLMVVAISTLEWTTNRYRKYMHKLKPIWQSNKNNIFCVRNL